ncbi:MAG: 50S ribosomal protein L11 methyltransferase [Bradymonadia bacterium]
MSWWRLSVNVPMEQGETLSWLIAEQADVAVEIQDESTMVKSAVTETGKVRLVISSATPPDDDLRWVVEGWLQRFGITDGDLTVERREDEDWRTGWRAWFTGRQISARIAVRPPWEPEATQPGVHDLIIEPGMAFGTGTHETTRGALKLLDEMLGARTDHPTLLDVGSGSGLLAFAAWRLGARPVGVEIDPVAVENARHNRGLNGADDAVELHVGSAADVEGLFDIVVVNIIAPVLIEIADQVKQRVAGDLILSGMLAHEREQVLAAYPEFTVLEAREEGQWSVLHLRRSVDEA